MGFPDLLVTTTINLGPPISHLTAFNGFFVYGLQELRDDYNDSFSFLVFFDNEDNTSLGRFWEQQVVRYKTDIIEDGKILFVTFNFSILHGVQIMFQIFVGDLLITDYPVANWTGEKLHFSVPVLVTGDGSTSFTVFCRLATRGKRVFFEGISQEVR